MLYELASLKRAFEAAVIRAYTLYCPILGVMIILHYCFYITLLLLKCINYKLLLCAKAFKPLELLCLHNGGFLKFLRIFHKSTRMLSHFKAQTDCYCFCYPLRSIIHSNLFCFCSSLFSLPITLRFSAVKDSCFDKDLG